MIITQVLGVWKTKNPMLKQWSFEIVALFKKSKAWNIKHVDGRDKKEAHEATPGMIKEVLCYEDGPSYVHGKRDSFPGRDVFVAGKITRGEGQI